jgi:hypothetical protein
MSSAEEARRCAAQSTCSQFLAAAAIASVPFPDISGGRGGIIGLAELAGYIKELDQ